MLGRPSAGGLSLKAIDVLPFAGAAADLGGGEVDVPERDEGHREQPTGTLPAAPLLDHPVVVRLDAGERDVLVGRLQEGLSAESGHGREAERRLPCDWHPCRPGVRPADACPAAFRRTASGRCRPRRDRCLPTRTRRRGACRPRRTPTRRPIPRRGRRTARSTGAAPRTGRTPAGARPVGLRLDASPATSAARGRAVRRRGRRPEISLGIAITCQPLVRASLDLVTVRDVDGGRYGGRGPSCAVPGPQIWRDSTSGCEPDREPR
jgi:hypothetical protein